MTHAYEETYLDDAMNNLGDMIDYAVNDCGYEGEEFFSQFILSGIANDFGGGNPKYVAGMSGPELARAVIFKISGRREEIPPSVVFDKSPEYWVGWIAAYYQWHTSHSFKDMQNNGLTFERMLSLYKTLHEADVSKFVEIADKIIEKKGER